MIQVLEKNKTIYINSEKKTVTVRATINAVDFTDWIYAEQEEFLNSDAHYFPGNQTFVGVARYKDNDDVNVENAIHIAQSKMERQYYKYIKNNVKAEVKTISNYLNSLENKLKKTESTVRRIDSHIINIANNPNPPASSN